MIASAVQFISSQLEGFLKTETADNNAMVKLSALALNNGKPALTAENCLTISVVNIENDSRIARNTPPGRLQDGVISKAPPLYLDVSILISSSVKDKEYVQGLHLLSLAIGFFQKHSVFTTVRYKLPPGIEKLSVELSSIDMDRMNGMWVALGTSYRPSVVYKLRILKMEDDAEEKGLPVLTRPDFES